MPRNYKRTTTREVYPATVLLEALKEVRSDVGLSIREISKKYGISKSTLWRKLQKYDTNVNNASASLHKAVETNFSQSQIFSTEEEKSLEQYILTSARMFYGLTTVQARTLAYETAIHNSLKVPEIWKENGMAGKEWLWGFMKRHPDLSLRKPEATSIARASAFNEHNVNVFFSILEETIRETQINGFRIFNLDESGFTTVQKPNKIIAPKGKKQIGQITSRERGELVTVCGIVSAGGWALPPVLIFPRVNFKGFMINGAPEGTLGLSHSSGWMTSQNFLKVIEHFVQLTLPSNENQVILIMDNHESHLSLEVLLYAKNNHVHIITLPPHTSHKTQPLDRTVFGPMKFAFNNLMNAWIMQHPAKPITIYDMAALIGESWKRAATPVNILSGFKASGIWPLDRSVFTKDDFMPSDVTNRKISSTNNQPVESRSSASASSSSPLHIGLPVDLGLPTTSSAAVMLQQNAYSVTFQNDISDRSTTSKTSQTLLPALCKPGSSSHIHVDQKPIANATILQDALKQHSTLVSQVGPANVGLGLTRPISPCSSRPISGENQFVSPEFFKGYPTADAQKQTTNKRKKGKSMRATATPEIKRIEAEAVNKTNKRTQVRPKQSKRKLFQDEKTDCSSAKHICTDDTDSTESDADSSSDRPTAEQSRRLVFTNYDVNSKEIAPGVYSLCEFRRGQSLVYYVGQIKKAVNKSGEVEMQFLKKSNKFENSFFTSNEELSLFPLADIRAVLSKPKQQGTTKRTKDFFSFNVDFNYLTMG